MNPKLNPYTNVFMLTKKYTSISDVRLQEVIEAFPLTLQDKNHSYILRFESTIQISNNKKMTVWQDINPSQDICVPHKAGKIRIKVLKLPRLVKPKVIQSEAFY